MHTVISRTARVTLQVISTLSRPTFRRVTCVVVTLLSGFVLLSGNLATRKAESRNLVTVRAAGRGKPFFNFQDGRQLPLTFRGESNTAKALQSGNGTPRSLASADLDGNGTPDVVTGYANGGTGVITIQRGNPDAFAPADDSVFVRVQQGYDPPSLLPDAEVYPVQAPADFVVVGNFNHSSVKDILFAAKGGGLYLMAGDGKGGFGPPEQISLPGPVTALAAGEFRAADGFADVAVGVTAPGGDALLVFDGADGLSNPLVQYPLAGPASGIEFGGLDDDPFQDIAVAAGNEIAVVHGWGRKESVAETGRIERINLKSGLRGLALGEFTWDRDARSEMAALTDDGAVQIVQQKKLDTRPFTEQEKATRTRGNMKFAPAKQAVDVESVQSWRPGKSADWTPSSRFSVSVNSASAKPIIKTNLSYREMDDVMVMGGAISKVEILRPIGPNDPVPDKASVIAGASSADDVTMVSLDSTAEPIAAITLPRKINGVQDLVMLGTGEVSQTIVPNAPNTTITVDRTDDPSGAGLTAASACTAAANDCSLRGAFQFANLPANNNTTISLPANTYILSINGTGAGGCDGNTVGDLGANQTVSITGAGAATTIIRQTGTGPANDGDRVMCMNEPFTTNLIYNFSGVTFVGGRDGTAAGGGAALGGGGIIGGELNNSLTLTNVVLANNQVTVLGSSNLGGGGIQITGGNLIITNSTIGGTNAPGLYTDRTSTNTANLQAGSGGGVTYTPSSPAHTGGTGTLTVTGSTFSRNTAAGIGGGGADLLIFAFAAPGGIGSGSASIGTSTFSNNQANGGGNTSSGGGIIVESLPTTVATTSLTSNSATNRGGGIFVGGGSLLLNGTSPSISFTGNTATLGGSSVSTSAPVNVDGTNTTIGGDIEIGTGGTWTNNTGSTLAPTNVLVTGGTFVMNNSTMNVGGDLTIGPGQVVGGTFNGNTGTVNIQGNFVLNAGGAPATSLNAGTGTFNFNGTGTQSITNGTSITFFNLTDSNTTQPLTLNNSLAVNSSLNVNGANAILSPVAGAVISGTGTLTGTGTARVSRIAATPDFLSQYTITNKTLTNLTIDYNGAGNQTVNNTPAYSNLTLSGSGIKTLQGNTVITGNLNIIGGSTFASGNFNFALGGNWTNGGSFTAGTGTVTFQGTTGTQLLSGNTTFFNLTLNNSGATTSFGTTTTTVGNDLVATAGTMDGSTSTIIFTGTGDNAGSISGAAVKNFHNLQINSPATISNTTGANINISNDFSNTGTFNQAAGITTTFVFGPDGIHALSGAGSSTFGNFIVNSSNTVNGGSHNFNVIGASFSVDGTFNGNTGTATFNGGAAQAISGNGAKNFGGLLISNVNGVMVGDTAPAVDASVAGILTLNTDLTVSPGAILQQSGTSAGAADVIGTVRRTDLGITERSFGNVNNSITINSGTPPTQMDFNLVKAAPGTFPATTKVVPRDITLTPTGGSGISATLKMRYIDPGELTPSSITESRLIEWKNVGGTTWTPQGGVVDTTNNFVSLAGVSSFSEWAIAEGSDLTLAKANNVGGAAVTGQAWNWTLTATNAGAPATFTAGQTIISDNLPNANLNYGTPTVQNVSNITGSANISCSITSNDLTCTANGGSVTFDSNLGVSKFDVVFSATPQTAASFANPRAGGNATIDPNGVIPESNESNNTATTNTVVVSKANTTTTITNAVALGTASVVGQPVTVTWSVSVNSPGSVGAALTGNVTVSDGTNNCTAAVSAGQCDITFTSPGAKSLTATYAGDGNYNGSASTPATPHTVNKADTTTTITSDNPDPSTPGQSVTVQWTVTVNAPGGGTPTGTVTVTVSGGVETCNAPVATGQCSLVLNTTGTRTITATYPGDPNFNGSSDTESHDVLSTTVSVNDAKVAEPPSATANMLFAVILSGPAPAGGASVQYATQDQAPGPGHAVGGASCGTPGVDYVTASLTTLNFAAGEQVKTVSITVCSDTDNSEPDETFLLNLSNPVNTSIVDGQAVGTITTANTAGTFLISELRTSGPGGAGDDFVELYNNTNSPLTVSASDGSAGYGVYKIGADCNAAPVLIATIPNGTLIPARGHYLVVGSAYSLANYGGAGNAAGNVTMSQDIENDRNVAVFSTANLLNISSANVLDAVGFGTNTGNVCALMREGNNLPAISGSIVEYSFFRSLTAGNPKDTNDNAADLLFADTQGTLVAGQQRLGAPGPENLASPIRRDNGGMLLPLLDSTLTASSAPNRFRDFTPAPPTGPNGTLQVRRRVQNTTGATVTRLRFRIVDVTTFPSPGAGTADLRVLTSSAVVISNIQDAATCASTGTPTTVPCQVTAQVTTLETPPAQANGGGYNSTLSVSIPGGLANNASIDVNFTLGVVQTGTFRFKLIIEALP